MCFLIVESTQKIDSDTAVFLFKSACNFKSTDYIDFYYKCKLCLDENRLDLLFANLVTLFQY